MPVATRKSETIRRELKSAPPDGFVVLRQLSYDEMLERRDGATKMLLERGDSRTADAAMAVQIANKWSNHYSFPKCIVDHNLTNEDGVPLDFRNPVEVFKFLDPRVGSEIERYIDELNSEEEPDVNFTSAPNGSSPEETIKPSEPLEQS